jgi:preprotein translocase subunit SecE
LGAVESNKVDLMSVETTESRYDTVKWTVVFALVAVAVVGNSYYADQSLLYRVLGILAIAGIAGVVALQTAKGAAFWALVKGSRTEIRKVVWPTRQETVQTTMIVVAFVLLVALLLWGLDSFLGWLVSLAIA